MPWTALALAAALSAVTFLLSGCVYVYVERGGYYRPLPPASPPASYYGCGSYPCPEPWTAPSPTPSTNLHATGA
jgi:hypothetical protein